MDWKGREQSQNVEDRRGSRGGGGGGKNAGHTRHYLGLVKGGQSRICRTDLAEVFRRRLGYCKHCCSLSR